MFAVVAVIDQADYAGVAVFEDRYGNLWALIEFTAGHPMSLC